MNNMLKIKIEEIIKELELLKEQTDVLQIDFEAPHIEEIGGDSFYTYGIVKSKIEITYKDEYRKINDFMSNWEKIK